MAKSIVVMAVLLSVNISVGEEPLNVDSTWAFERITLKNDAEFQGLIVAELPNGVQFQIVRRTAGRPTVTMTTLFRHQDIARIERLGFIGRFLLRARINSLELGHSLERNRIEAVQFENYTNADIPLTNAMLYRSQRFVLIATTSEPITRRVVVRLEQIYAAYERVLPPRREPTAPTTIYLVDSPEAYRAVLGPTSKHLLNPAVYDPAKNRIVCGSDFRRLGQELNESLDYHRGKFDALQAYEQRLEALYKGYPQELNDFRLQIATDRRRLIAEHRKNERRFDDATQALFAILYHEAFHAYVATSVYPTLSAKQIIQGVGPGALPRWLDEGLAQIFETAILEAGELRVGHADAVRLKQVQECLNNPESSLVPLTELLRTEPKQFLAGHMDEQESVDRLYLTAWSLAFYLTFEMNRVGHPGFDAYLRRLNLGADPVAAFEEWAGPSADDFERDWHAYLGRLKPDGTLGNRPHDKP